MAHTAQNSDYHVENARTSERPGVMTYLAIGVFAAIAAFAGLIATVGPTSIQ